MVIIFLADVLCLNNLSFTSLVQEYSNSVCSCLQVSHKRTTSHLHRSSSSRSSSNRSPPFKHLAFLCVTSKDVSESCLSFFAASALPSFICVVVVVLVVEDVVVVVCVARVPLLQNAHWHITVCVREKMRPSSSCCVVVPCRPNLPSDLIHPARKIMQIIEKNGQILNF